MPDPISTILLVLAAGWLGLTWTALRDIRCVGPLPAGAPAAGTPPRVSVVVAVRDEATRIAETVRSLVRQTGVDLEIVVADDRSTDGTCEILTELSREHPRVQILRIDSLPPGWLGKPHACHAAARRASGDWLLFTDGDAWMKPDLLARAVAQAEREGVDHLCLLPGQGRSTVPGRAGLLCCYFLFAVVAGRTNRDRHRGPVGVGAFNLVRAEAYRAVGGHEPLRLEIIDDAMLGLLLRRNGGRARVFTAHGDLEVDWARSLVGIVRALEKNLFAAVGFSVPLATLAFALPLAAWVGAVLGPLLGNASGLAAAGALASTAIPAWVLARRAGWSPAPALLAPVFFPVIPAAIAHSTLKTLRQGGVRWRETFYPLERLRRGRLK